MVARRLDRHLASRTRVTELESAVAATEEAKRELEKRTEAIKTEVAAAQIPRPTRL